jgi:hypothetical protein
LDVPANASASPTAFFNTADDNGGNVLVSSHVHIQSGTNDGVAYIFGRSNATSSPATWYALVFVSGSAEGTTGIRLEKAVSGSVTNLTSTLASLAQDVWYKIFLQCNNNSIIGRVQRQSDSTWLNSSGTFVSGQQDALSVTDSSITGSGYYGFGQFRATGSGNTYWDDFSAVAVGPPTLTAGTVTATSLSTGAVTLSSTNVAGGTNPYSIQWYKSTDGSSYSTLGSPQTGSTGSVTAKSDSGLTDGQRYWYKYIATDNVSATTNSNIVVVVPHNSGTHFYVAAGGSDSNTGLSTGSAWQTVGRANDYLSASALAGDTLSFNGGDTFSGTLSAYMPAVTPPDASARLTINSYGTGQGIISAGTADGIDLNDMSYVDVTNLSVTGSGVTSGGVTSNTGYGIYASLNGSADLNGIRIYGNTVSGFGPAGIYCEGFTSNNFNGVFISNNTVGPIQKYGIILLALSGGGLVHGARFKNPYIGSNTVFHVYGDGATNTGYGMHLNCLSGGIVERNYVHDCGGASGTSAGGPTGIITIESNGTVIQYNEVGFQFTKEGADGEGIDCDGGSVGCIVQYNYIHDCDGPGMMDFNLGGAYTTTTNNTFRFNILQNNGRRSASASSGGNPATFFASNSGTNGLVHNNTVYDTNASGSETTSIFDSSVSGLILRDNIIVINGSGRTFGTVKNGTLLQGNYYYAYNSATFSLTYNSVTYTSLASLQAVAETVNSVAVGSTANPSLTNLGGGGSAYPLGKFAGLTAYDPTSTVASAGGLDMAGIFGTNPGSYDFHGNPVHDPSTGGYPVGAIRAAAPAAGGGARLIDGTLIGSRP